MKDLGRPGFAAIAVVALLTGLLGLVSNPASASGGPTQSQWRKMGHTHAPSGTLHNGCRYYHYTYRVHPPIGTWWSLETFIVGPHHRRLASDVIISGANPRSGTKKFQLCRVNTGPGRFEIRAKLTYKDYPDEYTGWVTPSYFRLKRA